MPLWHCLTVADLGADAKGPWFWCIFFTKKGTVLSKWFPRGTVLTPSFFSVHAQYKFEVIDKIKDVSYNRKVKNVRA